MDLTEAEDIKKRWQEYIELYKKDLHDPDNHNGVITHLEPDILECEVKSALGSTTMNEASGGDGIPVELFQILKDDAVKVPHSVCQQIWKVQQWPQDWKISFSFHFQRRAMPKNVQTTLWLHSFYMLERSIQLHSYHMLETLCLKSFKVVFNSMWTKNSQMFKLYLAKAEEPEIKLLASIEWEKKQENFREILTSASFSMLKPLTMWITRLWNIPNEMGIPVYSYLPHEKSVCGSRSNS